MCKYFVNTSLEENPLSRLQKFHRLISSTFLWQFVVRAIETNRGKWRNNDRGGKRNARGHYPRPTNLRTSWTTTIFPPIGHVAHPGRHKYEHFAVDTPRACFLSWCPNSRSRTILSSPCSAPQQILVDPFKTRSATHKGSALSYARYYTLYRISFHLLRFVWTKREGRPERRKEKEDCRPGDVRVGVLHVYTYARLRFVDRA